MSQPPKPTVLIVEDECLIRMLAVEAFLDEGFSVLEAEHADSALAVYGGAGPVHVLFTDVNMPGELNGIDLAEHLKSLLPALHIIIASAVPLLRSVGHIPATFVTKPYDLQQLCSTAKTLLAA
jgi:CheY-like chemotaxis protein